QTGIELKLVVTASTDEYDVEYSYSVKSSGTTGSLEFTPAAGNAAPSIAKATASFDYISNDETDAPASGYTVDLGDGSEVLVKDATIKIGGANLMTTGASSTAVTSSDGQTPLSSLLDSSATYSLTVDTNAFTVKFDADTCALELTTVNGASLENDPTATFDVLKDSTPQTSSTFTNEYTFVYNVGSGDFTFNNASDSVTLPDGTEITNQTSGQTLSAWLALGGNGYSTTEGTTKNGYTSVYNSSAKTLTVTTTSYDPNADGAKEPFP
ncbi:MAG: hypothetical protein IJS15_16340, partial [Victivallales bacterium]|nr:hypothetical protein [Victivallales bacterium]